uniref:Uncharacterized protein n=1 Tax=Tanacetum cinerariifolium TaxID=118510 RepID=A0A6L2J4P8_TANCI|nr:hypothetical protein [Tanacetum cinerariifolium]
MEIILGSTSNSTVLIIADIIEKYESVPKRLEDEYHVIKDDTLLRKRKGKQVTGETSSLRKSLKIAIKQQKPVSTAPPPPSDDQERDDIHEATLLSLALHQTTKIAKEQENMAVPRSHKENLVEVDDDDEEEANKDDNKDDDDDDNNDDDNNDDDHHDDQSLIRNRRMGSSKIRTEKTQTPIPSPPRSPRKDLFSDKDIGQELTVSVSPTLATSSQDHSKPTSRKSIFFQEDAWLEDTIIDEDEVILEDETPEVIEGFQNLGLESYQIKINLTTPTLILPGIEECDPYYIVDKPTTGLIHFYKKNEKRVLDLIDIPKFCNATLERVLKEVKLKIFETEFLKKAPLLGELDLDIMKACER